MDEFRFSHDRYFGRFGLDEFKRTAEELESIVNVSRSHVDSFVLTCEDQDTYDWSKVSFIMDLVDKALEQRKKYFLKEFNQEIWDRSFRSQLTMAVDNQKDFRVNLIHDKGEENRLFFYGGGLDNRTYKNIMNRFHKRGWLYRLSNGRGNPSRLMGGIIKSKFHLNQPKTSRLSR